MDKERRLNKTVKRFYQQRIDNFFAKVIILFTKQHPLRNIILLESHNDFDCNGGAFYDYLIENHYNDRWKIVWLLKNAVPKKLPHNVKGYRLFHPSIMKSYYRCVAKYIAADDYMTQKKRPDQKEFYLTHGGITFKNVQGLLVIQDHVDYVLSSSLNYDPFISKNYSIDNPGCKLLHLGFPSNDVLFHHANKELEKITDGQYDKVILWIPTFRESVKIQRVDCYKSSPLGIPLIEDLSMYGSLNDYLREHRVLLIIKIHPIQDLSTVKISDMTNIKVLTPSLTKELSVDLYRLMACCDACISDYSSAAYSYLLLNRPLAFILSDLEDYKRGFSVDNYVEFLPGELIYEFDDLISFLSHVITDEDDYHEKRTKLLDFLYEYQDGNASRRLVEFMGLDAS